MEEKYGASGGGRRIAGQGRQKYITDISIIWTRQIIKAVLDVLKSDAPHLRSQNRELEERLCSITGAKHAVSVSNGTAALHIACLAAGSGPGDEVITTPVTFAASANCAPCTAAQDLYCRY